MARNNFSSMKDLLPGVLSGLAKQTGDARALRPLWEEAAGSPICLHSRPIALEGSTLVIEVGAATWARELEANSEELLARLREKLGASAPTALAFRMAVRKP